MEKYRETYRMVKRLKNDLVKECIEFLTQALEGNNAISFQQEGCYVYVEKYDDDAQDRCEVIGYATDGTDDIYIIVDDSDKLFNVKYLPLESLVDVCMTVEEVKEHNNYSFEDDYEDCMNC